jgi:hypothetical protein
VTAAATLDDDLVDVEDAAVLLKVAPATVRKWISQFKVLPRGKVNTRSPYRRRGRLLYSVSDLLDAEAKARPHPRKPIDV